MTVEDTITKKIYEGNGLATEFPVPFAYSRADDLYLLHVSVDFRLKTELVSDIEKIFQRCLK